MRLIEKKKKKKRKTSLLENLSTKTFFRKNNFQVIATENPNS